MTGETHYPHRRRGGRSKVRGSRVFASKLNAEEVSLFDSREGVVNTGKSNT